MKKYNRQQIIELRAKGLTIRGIQKKIGASSTSVIDYHLRYKKEYQARMKKLFVLPERLPPNKRNLQDECLCAGFNEYRQIILDKIDNLKS